MSGQTYRDLFAWQKAIELVVNVYRTTHDWPKEELHGLTNQVRRAVVSVPANIAEGQGRSGNKTFAHHLSIAYGSLSEVETHLVIAQRLHYMDVAQFQDLMDQAAEIGRLLNGLMRRLRIPTEASPAVITDY
ncbi:MAG: four helix bundle protein [Chloroflexota bacterium]|nr:four helix bundle protein [Chloroflexota bacterium]MDQ6908440.1 four helix bundle protein [Chloroflexota bacterium]